MNAAEAVTAKQFLATQQALALLAYKCGQKTHEFVALDLVTIAVRLLVSCCVLVFLSHASLPSTTKRCLLNTVCGT